MKFGVKERKSINQITDFLNVATEASYFPTRTWFHFIGNMCSQNDN